MLFDQLVDGGQLARLMCWIRAALLIDAEDESKLRGRS